jgi:hypothetical protein
MNLILSSDLALLIQGVAGIKLVEHSTNLNPMLYRYINLGVRCFALVMLLAIVGFSMAQPVWAGRAVFNQTPEQIDRTFGRYWTKLTQRDGDGKVYTYSPARFRAAFPNYPASRFVMIYRDGRVQSVQFLPYPTIAAAKAQEGPILSEQQIETEQMEAKVFEAVLGYRPAIYKPLHQITGVWPRYTTCLGDGVASQYALLVHSEMLTSGFTLFYDKQCEPPYDKIKLTIERGPSGG